MNIIEMKIPGLKLIEPSVFGDPRGYFFESWNQKTYQAAGIEIDFVQDNVSFSEYGVLRGLHYQSPNAQGKLVQVLLGEVFDVAVDIRKNSATFGQVETVVLSAQNKKQFFVPPGFAHGFCVISETALFSYKCSAFYAPQDEFTIAWDDPELAITWPVAEPKLSSKDLKGLKLSTIPHV